MLIFEFFTAEWTNTIFGPLVVGRGGPVPFGVGDVFHELCWRTFRIHRNPTRVEPLEEGVAAEVALTVEGIFAHGQAIDQVDAGLTAGLRLCGQGLEAIQALDVETDIHAGRSWFLRGWRTEGTPS